MPGLGLLNWRYRDAEARCCFFGFCEPLREFRTVHRMSQDRPFVQKNLWRRLGWACEWKGVGSQGITWVEQPVSAMLMETEIWWLPMSVWWIVGGLNKGTMDTVNTSV